MVTVWPGLKFAVTWMSRIDDVANEMVPTVPVPGPGVTVGSGAAHVRFPVGMRTRISVPVLILGVTGSSVMTIGLIRVGGSPTPKAWSAPEAIVGAPMALGKRSVAAMGPPMRTRSCRLVPGGAQAAKKLVN